MSRTVSPAPVLSLLLAFIVAASSTAAAAEAGHAFGLTVTSDPPSGNVPFDPTIDFAKIIAVAKRPPLVPQNYTPLVGVGDLLRYNAGRPRPFAMPYPARLVDLTGDGKPDYVGTWNYAYRDDSPWDGIICYPCVGDPEKLEFGDLVRVRYVDKAHSTNFKHYSKIYMTSDFADLNGDGLVDVVYSPSGGDKLHLYLNSRKRDAGGMPIFTAAGSISRHTSSWTPCRGPCPVTANRSR